MIDNITNIRTTELELLAEFAKVCGEHELKWYAFFGTLLGVMRGGGYLPLDDDVDVAMPMEDYGMLLSHKEWFNPERFFLQTPLDPGLPRYAKLRRNGTTAFRDEFVEELRREGHHGICIDIIPLASLPGMDCYHTPSVTSPEKTEAVYKKEWFEPASEGCFETLRVRVPKAARKVLTEVYGDWAWPHGARSGALSYWFADPEKDYSEYVRRYTGMLDGIDGKKLFLFGAADSLRIWLERFDRREQVVCTFDNDPGKWGKEAYGVPIRDPKDLPGLYDKDSRVIIVSLWHQEIGRQLEEMGIRDYYVYIDEYYDESVGNQVIRREDSPEAEKLIPKWG